MVDDTSCPRGTQDIEPYLMRLQRIRGLGASPAAIEVCICLYPRFVEEHLVAAGLIAAITDEHELWPYALTARGQAWFESVEAPIVVLPERLLVEGMPSTELSVAARPLAGAPADVLETTLRLLPLRARTALVDAGFLLPVSYALTLSGRVWFEVP